MNSGKQLSRARLRIDLKLQLHELFAENADSHIRSHQRVS